MGKLPQAIFLNGYEISQSKSLHVTVRTLHDHKKVAHFQVKHELSGDELVNLAELVKKIMGK